MPELPEPLLSALVADLTADPAVIGVLLGGSYARGDATPFSDLDLAPFYPDEAVLPPKRFFYRAGILVSISPKTVAAWRAGFTTPELALVVVPSLRSARLLYDPLGALAALQGEAAAFVWADLQQAAYQRCGHLMIFAAEWVHKILGAIMDPYHATLAYAIQDLTAELTQNMALFHGVFIQSHNIYYAQVQTAVGDDSLWSLLHRASLGYDHQPLRERGFASVRLYGATASLIAEVLTPDQRDFIAATCALIHTTLA